MRSEPLPVQIDTDYQSGRVPASVNYELIFRQISSLGTLATQSMTSSSHEKSGCTQMQNPNDVASNEMLWAEAKGQRRQRQSGRTNR
jgi:hypothetical protein